MPQHTALGSMLLDARVSRQGRTQQQVADEVNAALGSGVLTRAALGHYERGDRSPPLVVLRAICEAVRLTRAEAETAEALLREAEMARRERLQRGRRIAAEVAL